MQAWARSGIALRRGTAPAEKACHRDACHCWHLALVLCTVVDIVVVILVVIVILTYQYALDCLAFVGPRQQHVVTAVPFVLEDPNTSLRVLW